MDYKLVIKGKDAKELGEKLKATLEPETASPIQLKPQSSASNNSTDKSLEAFGLVLNISSFILSSASFILAVMSLSDRQKSREKITTLTHTIAEEQTDLDAETYIIINGNAYLATPVNNDKIIEALSKQGQS